MEVPSLRIAFESDEANELKLLQPRVSWILFIIISMNS